MLFNCCVQNFPIYHIFCIQTGINNSLKVSVQFLPKQAASEIKKTLSIKEVRRQKKCFWTFCYKHLFHHVVSDDHTLNYIYTFKNTYIRYQFIYTNFKHIKQYIFILIKYTFFVLNYIWLSVWANLQDMNKLKQKGESGFKSTLRCSFIDFK